MDTDLRAQLKEISDAAYANGFAACVIRMGEEAISRPGVTAEHLHPMLVKEAHALPGYKAANTKETP